jgi:hypothetical protein
MPRPKDHAGKDFSQRLTNTTKTGAVPRGYQAPRDVHVPVINLVACPSCKAEIGERCQHLTKGTPTSSAHPIRRRMAVRLFNAQRASTA